MTGMQTSTTELATIFADMRQAGLTHAACISITDTSGSSPRERGCQMLITADKLYGSIGGGKLEFKIMQIARNALAQYPCIETSEQIRVPLGPSLGQCCGGVVNLLMEILPLSRLEMMPGELQNNIYPSNFQVAIFGAGHVGQALVSVLAALPCSVIWIDSREEIFPDQLSANVEIRCVEDPEFEVQTLAPHSYCVVTTHSHQLDEKIVSALLKRNDVSCCGLIGSKSKALRFKKRLTARGLTTEQLSQLVCPMGDPAIKGKHPGEIALSMASQLLQMHQNDKLTSATAALRVYKG